MEWAHITISGTAPCSVLQHTPCLFFLAVGYSLIDAWVFIFFPAGQGELLYRENAVAVFAGERCDGSCFQEQQQLISSS